MPERFPVIVAPALALRQSKLIPFVVTFMPSLPAQVMGARSVPFLPRLVLQLAICLLLRMMILAMLSLTIVELMMVLFEMTDPEIHESMTTDEFVILVKLARIVRA